MVEDHEVTRVGLKLTLRKFPEIEIVGEASDGKQAVELAVALQPNVVLMDIGLPLLDGIEATGQIKKAVPEARVIMRTSHENDLNIFAALGAGADGYCLKGTATAQLVLAIRTVSEGAAWLDPGIATKVLRASVTAGLPAANKADKDTTSKVPGTGPRLSQREIDVLRLVVEGLGNQAIAERLYLSVETVKTHMRRIMEKLAVSDRTQAAVKAMREDLL